MAHVITLNAGSASIKFALFEDHEDEPVALAIGLAEEDGNGRHIKVRDANNEITHEDRWRPEPGVGFHTDTLARVLNWRRTAFPHAQVIAAGHRVVHGGPRMSAPTIITDAVLDDLRGLIPLAPLHLPQSIAGILAAREAWPHVQQVACFDTAFHRGQPYVADIFAIPRHFYDEGVRRYGFHGLSYEYVSAKLRQIAPHHAAGRVVVAHLGNGASMCAIHDGLSVSSTMGFTALDGLPMGTRCGQLDPGVVLYLMQERGMSADAVSNMLYRESGLKGLSGISHDMRELEAAGTTEANQAIEYFVSRIRRELGGFAAVLKGLDAVVFCGGIGENSWHVRERVLEGMEWIGVELDRTANRHGDKVISTDRSRVRVFVIPTNEEAMIARHTLDMQRAAMP